jgi:hypothetical protein
MTVPLTIFLSTDPGYFDSPDVNLKLWDFTIPDRIREYTGAAKRPQDAIKALLKEYADDAPYPEGNIRFEITPATLGYSGIYRETVVYPTDGGTKLAATLRGISLGATIIGAGAAVLGQAEIALPMFALAGFTAGAGGVANLSDRLTHGDFEWDTQTLLDVLDIAAGVLTAGVAGGATTTARGIGQVTLSGRLQLVVGQAQLGIMAGIHASAISTAISTGNKDEVAKAILNAARDGALVLFVHRASARLRGGLPGKPPEAPEGIPGTRTAGGTTRGGTPPERVPEEGQTPARPGTPEFYRQQHESWARRVQTEGMGERDTTQPAAPAGEPLPRGTVRDNIPTPDEAYRIYEDALSRAPGKEAGIYRNIQTGRYAVRVGTEMSVSAPGEGWESVLHYHPNPSNVLSIRMPAPADVQGAAIQALRAGRPVTEFVEHSLPGGKRGITSYTVRTQPVEITVEYQRPDGSRVRRTYSSLEDYQRAYFERTTYLDPNSPEYKWVMEDLRQMYGSGGEFGSQRAGGERTARGAAGEPEWARVQREGLAESMAYWNAPGRTTDTSFARHNQTFRSIVATLRNTARQLAGTGRGNLLQAPQEQVLEMPADDFIRRSPGLNAEWNRLMQEARTRFNGPERDPTLALQMMAFLENSRVARSQPFGTVSRFLGGSYQPGAGNVGSRTPDIVEFFLDRPGLPGGRGEIVITDITLDIGAVHQFKTRFYRAVMVQIVGTSGPRVYGIDINPSRPASATVTP